MKKIILLFISFLIISPTFASNTESNRALIEYTKLSTNKKFNALAYIDSLISVFPDDYRFSYEKSIALIRETQYDKATLLLDSLVKAGVKDELVYQLLLNCYIQSNKVTEAIMVGDSGLVYFPNSARLLLEYGYLKKEKNEDITAVSYWEKGINSDPYYFDNYYPLIENYRKLNDNIWVAVYGEIFMNLSNKADRVAEISKSCYNTLISILPTNKDSSDIIQFTKTKFQYEPGIVDTTNYTFDIASHILMNHSYRSLCKDSILTPSIHSIFMLFKQFNLAWESSIYLRKLANPLFDYHKLLIERNLFEPYCYLMYKEGNNEEFNNYYKNNTKLFRELIKFMSNNPINLKPPYKVSKLFGY